MRECLAANIPRLARLWSVEWTYLLTTIFNSPNNLLLFPLHDRENILHLTSSLQLQIRPQTYNLADRGT